jgi:hypothetical protein
MTKKNKNERYLISYCTRNQFSKILRVLAETTGEKTEINV